MDIRINRIAAKTFRWLHMNDAKATDIEIKGSGAPETKISGLTDGAATEGLWDIRSGSGSDVDALMTESGADTRVYEAAKNSQARGEFHFTYKNDDGLVNRIGLVLREYAKAYVVMDFSNSDAADSGFAAVQTKVDLLEGADLTIVQIERTADKFRLIDDLGVKIGDNAHLHVIRLALTNGEVYEGVRGNLIGYKSYMEADAGYRIEKDGRLDMNFEAIHTGKKSESRMNASGVLRDQAYKLFRGTIDLQRGGSGAVGNENEDVLLMDESVTNKTIPLILCDEEDVVGNHGASIGRLDEGLIFYLESRGMDRKNIYEMMAEARINAVIGKIPDEETRKALTSEEPMEGGLEG